ncbi:hypothetical protein O181_102046 [Austropuccinia psidii MF-1]|uniref:Uncharacterized protein n=1 Tax=Austropuccinia psidii MF-1 TaxID=1389203 RepID=A0A9Q3JHX3_9BASI|nr:hypothetical protein [Austropuccinia psidii MF-1]
MNDVEAKVNFNPGEFFTCVGKDYLQIIVTEWKNYLLPIEGVQFGSASIDMYPLGMLYTNLVFPHPEGSVIMKTEIVLIGNLKYQHVIFANDYLNIYCIDINNHKDRYLKLERKKRQKFDFSNMSKQISIVSTNKGMYKEEFVTNKLGEAQINPALSSKMRQELIDVLYTYRNAFSSDNEPLGTISGNEVDINLNIDRPYPPVLRRPA